MQKRDFETYQKRFRDFEILPKFSETHAFRGTICYPSIWMALKTSKHAKEWLKLNLDSKIQKIVITLLGFGLIFAELAAWV